MMRSPKHFLYETILAAPLSIALLYLLREELGLSKVSVVHCLFAAAACAFCALYQYRKGNNRLILLGAAAIVLLLSGLYARYSDSADYAYNHRYLWLIPLLAVGCYLIAILNRFFAVRMLTAAGIVTCLVFLLVNELTVPKICVMLFLTVLILVFADSIQRRWVKQGDTSPTQHLVCIAPFVALWLFIALLFPVSSKPYDWNFFRKIWNRIEDFGLFFSQRFGRSDDFKNYMTGFSQNADVGTGGISENSTVLMHLRLLNGHLPVSLHLGGQTCDTLDGLTWISTVEDDFREGEFDYLETMSAFWQHGHVNDYIRSIELEVTYRDFTTKHVFTPEKPATRPWTLGQLKAVAQGENLFFDELKGVNFRYDIEGIRMNRLHPAFSEFMATREAITEESWTGWSISTHEDPNFSDLEAYRQRIRDTYLQPVNVSSKVRDFIDTVCEDETDGYARLLRLSQALSGFTYSRSPGALPETVTDGESYLDYFVDSRTGFCIHYATAMTLLARAEGYPARYVQGFLVPFLNDREIDVTGDMAHAWCEVYFENVGWIIFEATPGFASDAYWAVSGDGGVEPSVPTPYVPRPSIPTPGAPGTTEPSTTSTTKQTSSSAPLFITAAFVLLLLFAVIVLVLDRWITNRRYDRMSYREQMATLYRRNRNLLAWINLPCAEDETLTEYAERLSGILPPQAVKWIPSYEACIYGDADDSATEITTVALMEDANECLRKQFREQDPARYRIYRLFNRMLH